MKYVNEYVKANARVSAEIEPYGEVDYCAFAALPFLLLSGIVSDRISGADRTIQEVAELYSALDPISLAPGLFIFKEFGDLLLEMGKAPRYRDIRCFGFRHIRNEDTEEQFDALGLQLPNGELVVAFGGTDESLLGWKEDFNLGCRVHIAGQYRALDYLNSVLKERDGSFSVCGYSKGGNFAVFAAAMCDGNERMLRLYNFDGPGFPQDFIQSDEFQRISSRCLLIAPRYSAVSMMLHNIPCYVVTRCTLPGVFQHYCNRWEIEGNRFRREPDFSPESLNFHQQFTDMMQTTTVEERRLAIETIYDILKKTGAKTLTDLWSNSIHYAPRLHKAYLSLDKETRRLTTRLMFRFVRMIAENYSIKR